MCKGLKTINNKIDVYMLGLCLFELLLYIYLYLNNNSSIHKIPIKIFDLVIEMTTLNPCERLDINEAYNKYKKLFQVSR